MLFSSADMTNKIKGDYSTFQLIKVCKFQEKVFKGHDQLRTKFCFEGCLHSKSKTWPLICQFLKDVLVSKKWDRIVSLLLNELFRRQEVEIKTVFLSLLLVLLLYIWNQRKCMQSYFLLLRLRAIFWVPLLATKHNQKITYLFSVEPIYQ